MGIERKTISFQVKAIDDAQGIIEAYGSVFNNIDQGGDIVRPGAFRRTINNSKARIQAGKAKYLAPMLWQHDPERPIGGWTDLQEDAHGLKCIGQIILTTQTGRECYELIKAGVIDQFSIGYDIPSRDGAEYKDGNRELLELRLWEISPVTFAMNEEALLTGVKGASGGDLPLADKATAWSGSEAKKDILKAIGGDWSNAGAAKYFFWHAPNPSTRADYKLPFCANVGGEMKAVPKGIESCAGALGGARGTGVDIPEADIPGVKAKIASYYKKMDMTPPWEDSDKSVMTQIAKKDFNDHYRQEAIECWLYSEFQDLVCALKMALIDEFLIGDQPEEDTVNTILNDSNGKPGFVTALENWVQRGVTLDASNYLQETLEAHGMTGAYSPGYYMSNGSRRLTKQELYKLERKAGRAISATNAEAIQAHADNLHGMADKMADMMKEHMKALHSAANDIASMVNGSNATQAEGDTEDESASKSIPSRETHSPYSRSSQDTADKDIDAALSTLRSLRTA